jgi:glycosyltransferase involved in cell wall biosynthesis
MKFRFHALGVPHTITSEEFNACAFTQKLIKFGKMMTERGHEVIHYGHEYSDLICSEHVTVVSSETYEKTYGCDDIHSSVYKYDVNDEVYKEFTENSISEIGKRKQKNDIVLAFFGLGVKNVCDAHSDLIIVEPGIGYAYTFAPFKVYESYSLMHGLQGINHVYRCNPIWYDVVIPAFFDLKDFEFSDKKEDYMLFIGRIYDGKGVNVAMQICSYLDIKLKVAGQLTDEYKDFNWPENVEFVGHADINQRKELMSKAMGVFVPSMYNEPFGCVQIESLLSGTPTITTDWGAFTENNINGVTGYRCRTFSDFVNATRRVINGEIDYSECRKHGERFSLENVAPMFEKYFEDVLNIYTKNGWYECD